MIFIRFFIFVYGFLFCNFIFLFDFIIFYFIINRGLYFNSKHNLNYDHVYYVL